MSTRKILIAGGSGLIGRRLASRLLDQGMEVHILSRKKRNSDRAGMKYFIWDTNAKTMDENAWSGVTDLVQLAGAPIADHKWTDEYKEILLASRVRSTETLVESLKKNSLKLDHVYAASAIGYYGDRPRSELLDESSDAGSGFISELVIAWEEAGRLLKAYAREHTVMRIGLVLDAEDGFLQKFTPGLKLLTAPYFGKGDACFSWVHIDDITGYISWSLDKKLAASTNLVAPNPVMAKEFSQTLASVSSWPAIAVSVPSFGIKLAFGQRAEVILMGNNVQAGVLEEQGYPYAFSSIRSALENLL